MKPLYMKISDLSAEYNTKWNAEGISQEARSNYVREYHKKKELLAQEYNKKGVSR